ncbi:MAG: VCBS repeat-containing protein [Candidatus Aminicenantaceae bacterium]
MLEKDILESWKEIARYLHRDVRTCQRWERELGLPVQRLDDSPKARVFAYKEDIDCWLKEKQNTKETILTKILPKRRKTVFLFGAASIVVVCVVLFLGYYFLRDRIPTHFKIQDSKFIVLNKNNRVIWEYDTGLKDLETTAIYKDHFQFKKKSPERPWYYQPYLMIQDIDGTESIEVLFTIQTTTEKNEGQLICFSDKGEILWDYHAGRRMTYGSKEYSADYKISAIGVEDFEGDGSKEILVIGRHIPYFPTQITLLDSQGNKLGEYWHSGGIADFAFIDLDKDGIKEILLSGLNNEWRSPCCAVLDFKQFKGASPQIKDYYTCKDVESGFEKYYLLFPRNSLDLAINLNNAICEIDHFENDIVTFRSRFAPINYELDQSMTLVEIDLTHSFMNDYEDFKKEGKIHLSMDQIRQEILSQGIQYFDGEGWIKNATPTKFWKRKVSSSPNEDTP